MTKSTFDVSEILSISSVYNTTLYPIACLCVYLGVCHNVRIHAHHTTNTTLRHQSGTTSDLQHFTNLCATSICSSHTTVKIDTIAGVLDNPCDTACPSGSAETRRRVCPNMIHPSDRTLTCI
jgi:hypothetical protein